MELVLESVHQSLKRCVIRISHANPYQMAMLHALSNDSKGRISMLRILKSSEDEDVWKNSSIQILELLLGSKFKGLQSDVSSEGELLEKMRYEMDMVFTPALAQQAVFCMFLKRIASQKCPYRNRY